MDLISSFIIFSICINQCGPQTCVFLLFVFNLCDSLLQILPSIALSTICQTLNQEDCTLDRTTLPPLSALSLPPAFPLTLLPTLPLTLPALHALHFAVTLPRPPLP